MLTSGVLGGTVGAEILYLYDGVYHQQRNESSQTIHFRSHLLLSLGANSSNPVGT